MGNRRWRLRFRTAQIILLLTLLLTTVLVVGVSAYINARLAVEDLSGQVLEQTSQRTDQHINGLLGLAMAQSQLNENLINSDNLPPLDHWKMLYYFHEAMRANPQLSYLSFGTEGAEYWHVFRPAEGPLQLETVLFEDGTKYLTDYEPIEGGVRKIFREEQPKRDPRIRPYYVEAKEAGHALWTETYIFLGSEGKLNIPGVTRATPIYDEGELVGVLSADFDLDALSKFLQTLEVGKSGFAFILELRKDGRRQVIAHPSPDKLTRPVDPDDPSAGNEALAASEFDDARVRALVAKIPERIPAEATTGLVDVELTVDGTRYLAGYHQLAGDDVPTWLICMVLPEGDVMGRVDRLNRITLGVGVGGIVFAILLSILLSAQIARTLRQLAAETEEIAQFNLESKAPVDTRLIEMSQLASAIEEMKTGLRSFRKFVPTNVVRSVLSSGEEASLGGERREITLYFSDLAGFTSIAERMPAEELVQLLSEYLEAMTEGIHASAGNIDKFIGDAIMAFWNAATPLENHPLAACRTALVHQKRLVQLRAGWRASGRPELFARIGLHTGEAIVGNIGSESRFDYTAIGDVVNLASRLEGLNKHYGTEILISAATYERVKDDVVACPMDKVSVKGKVEGTLMYELVALAGEATDTQLRRIEAYRRGIELYFARRWADAEAAFAEARDADPTHGAAAVMLERIEYMRRDPPPPEWSGVHRMTEK